MLLLATGCGTVFGLDDPMPSADAGSSVDASNGTTTDARLCWGTDVNICLPASPKESHDLTGSLDTGTSSLCALSIRDYCVISGVNITVSPGVTVDVTGARPLVLIASETITIAGKLDVASHVSPRKPGPGAATAICGPFAVTPSTQGGGAGGTLAGVGGSGGSNNATPPATGGMSAPAGVVSGLRAGCSGQSGGGASSGFGLGGFGGGAVLLAAGAKIDIRGSVNASGAAGSGGACQSPCGDPGVNAYGGGGGGAGGMIILEAPVIANTGAVYADGGGGGEGASRSKSGVAGFDPAGTTSALGGSSTAAHGGNGGNGAFAALRNGTIAGAGSGDSPGAGGGGGGGAGVIRVRGASAITGSGSVSPPAS